MSTLAALNSYASGNIAFTADTIVFDRSLAAYGIDSFYSPMPTWIPISQLGNLTGYGVQVSFNMGTSNIVPNFPNQGTSDNPLTITNPSSGVYNIKGILNIIDYNAAQAVMVLPSGFTGNATYSATYTNTNTSAGNFVLSFVGTP